MKTATILANWTSLNRALMSGSEEFATTLLKAETSGKCRPAFLRRIHSRINKLRAMRERSQLGQPTSHRGLRDRSNRSKT